MDPLDDAGVRGDGALRHHIAFLHTSPVHVPTFTDLVLAVDHAVTIEHFVDETLLLDAQAAGSEAPAVIGRVQQATAAAASNGASLVICTCSTIGHAAEATPTQGHFAVLRVDRAMAECAVELGPRILVVAALESTVEPTTRLIRETARVRGTAVDIEVLVVPSAWQHFLRRDRAAYLLEVAEAVRRAPRNETVIVLAQASLAPLVEVLRQLPVPVLSSPDLGVQRIFRHLRG